MSALGNERHQQIVDWVRFEMPPKIREQLSGLSLRSISDAGLVADILGTWGDGWGDDGVSRPRLNGYYPDAVYCWGDIPGQVSGKLIVEVGHYDLSDVPACFPVLHLGFKGQVNLVNPGKGDDVINTIYSLFVSEYGELAACNLEPKSAIDIDWIMGGHLVKDGPGAVRDKAAASLMCNAGLRRNEIPRFDIADYDATSGRLFLGNIALGARWITLDMETQGHLSRWINLRGDAAGPLLCPVNKGGRVIMQRMSGQAIRNVRERFAAP